VNNWKRMTDHFECSCCHVAFEHIRISLMTGAKLIRGTCQGIVPFFQKSFFQFHLSAPSKSTQTSHPPNSTPACHPAMATSKGTRPWHPSYGILQCQFPFEYTMGRSWSHDNPEAHNVLLELWNIQRCAGICASCGYGYTYEGFTASRGTG